MKKIVLALIGLFFASTVMANPTYVWVKNKTNCTVYAKIYNNNYLTTAMVEEDIFSGGSALLTFASSDFGYNGYSLAVSFSTGKTLKGNWQCQNNPGSAEVFCSDKECHKEVELRCYPPLPCPGCKV